MKKLLLVLAFSFQLSAFVFAQPVIIPGSTNTATVQLRPELGNYMAVAAYSSTNDSNGFSFSVAGFAPVASGIMASNTWSLALATNGMKNGDFRVLNSNGVAQTSVWLSNGVAVLKQIAP